MESCIRQWFSWAIWYLSLKNPSKNAGQKNYFRASAGVGGGGLKKSGFTQISFTSKAFKINIMSWDTDLRLMSPFPLLKFHIGFLLLRKQHFWSILRCVNFFFFFWLPYNPTLGENSNFKLLSWKKITKQTNSENLKTVSLTVSSILHV